MEDSSHITTTASSPYQSHEEVGNNNNCHDQDLLPKAKGWIGATLSLYQNFWCPSPIIPNVIFFQTHFQAHDQDIILASKPKSGTTWLKALIFTIVNRSRYAHNLSHNNPLLTSNPHELVPFLEFTVYNISKNQSPPDLSNITPPRLFSTHIPFPSLPESVKSSNCRIVYLCRNPLDMVVSFWHFANVSSDRNQHSSTKESLEELLDMYCRGVEGFGPFWDHILGYWKQSMDKPQKVLFLKYEDLKEDNGSSVKKLAEFIGFPFSLEEERGGVVEEILKLCSLSSLKALEVNKNGKFMPRFENKCFFRKGEVGDWANYLSPSMVERMGKVMQEKFNGSGVTFEMPLSEQ